MKKNKLLILIVIPLLSCGFSSIVGLVLGQIGNQIYKLLGQSAACLSIPGFLLLFLLTFTISFFGSKLIRKKIIGA
jgi:ABC-type dipeptide/oligopeptide/nickel transport system permease subunit